MPRFLAVDHALILLSAVWLMGLALAPALAQSPVAFFVSVVIILANAAYSFRTLTRTRTIPVALNCTQIVLFGVLNYQLCRAFGEQHYRFDRETHFFDWLEFTAAHVLRAADVLDALDEWGWNIQVISHQSAWAGVLLVLMHVTVDVFLIDLALRAMRRWWPDPPRETRLAQGRREFGWFLATVGQFVFFVIVLQMRTIDWLLWPLDQLVRLVDIGDVLQVFGWQLHGVESNVWTDGAAFVFRLAAGIWVARFVILWRLTVFRTWGVGIEELTQLLDDPDAAVRRGAAMGLGQSGDKARGAVISLCESLQDMDAGVRCEAARALGQIGPDARLAVPLLVDAVWLGARDLRLAAIEALAGIGPVAVGAVYPLVCLLKVSDRETHAAATRALLHIAPSVLRDLPARFGPRKKKRHTVPRRVRLQKSWNRSLDADRARKTEENAVHALLLVLLNGGFFDVERSIDEIVNGVRSGISDANAAMLVMPLLRLTVARKLVRIRTSAGNALYRHYKDLTRIHC